MASDTVPASSLAHTIAAADVTRAGRVLVLLHGIYGRGRNWAAIARSLAAARPEWASALVDLRLVCTEAADYANPIEPSTAGGAKIARAVAALVDPADDVPRSRVVP